MLRNQEFSTVSLNVLVGEEENTELGKLAPDKSINLAEELELKDLHQRMLILLSKCGLTENEKKVILLRYGLINNKPITLESTGHLMGITRVRVGQIESAALRKFLN